MKPELMLSGTTFLLPGMLTWAETKSRELSYLFQWLPFNVFKLQDSHQEPMFSFLLGIRTDIILSTRSKGVFQFLLLLIKNLIKSSILNQRYFKKKCVYACNDMFLQFLLFLGLPKILQPDISQMSTVFIVVEIVTCLEN